MGYLASTTRVIKYFKPGKDGADAVRYWLVPSYTSVRVKDGKATPATVNCVLKKQVGKDTEMTVAPSAEGLAIKRCNTGSSSTSLVSYTAGDSVLVPADERYRAIQFQLYRGLNVIDTCTVAIVRDGASATTYYTWIVYANDTKGPGIGTSPVNADGTTKQYMGVSYNRAAPEPSLVHTDYQWSRYVGPQGIPGPAGTTLYTWVKYADKVGPNGLPAAADMYDKPNADSAWQGLAYNKATAQESDNPADYNWHMLRGKDGNSVQVSGSVDYYKPTLEGYQQFSGEEWATDEPFQVRVKEKREVNGIPVIGIVDVVPEEGDTYSVRSGDYAKHLIVASGGRWVDLGAMQGPKGDDGKDGKDSVSVGVSPETVVFKKGTGGYCDVNLSAYKGDKAVGLAFDPLTGSFDNKPVTITEGLKWIHAPMNGGTGYCLIYDGSSDLDLTLPFNVTVDSVLYPRKLHVKTVSDGAQGPQGRHGPALRVQRWEKCPEGFGFQCGKDGDEYKDVVVYKSDKDRYYECIDNHAKTAGNDPVTSIQDSMGLWKAGTQLNLVATDILLAEYARIANLGVEVIDICDYNDRGERTAVYFYADREGLRCNYGEFKHIYIDDASVTNATITSGRIAGFDIEGSILTNSSKDMDAAIIFRNDAEGCFAGIGTDMNSAVAGDAKTLARFENSGGGSMINSTVYISSVGSQFNTALTLNASGGAECNYAFCGVGNGVLNGWIGGYKLSRHVVNSANSGKAVSPFSLKENNVWILHAAKDGYVVPLPTQLEVQNTLNLLMGTPFCIRLTIVGDVGCGAIKLAGRGNSSYASEGFPVIIDNNGNVASTLTLQQGDSFEFLLVYFPDDTRSKDGFSLKYTARMINHTN